MKFTNPDLATAAPALDTNLFVRESMQTALAQDFSDEAIERRAALAQKKAVAMRSSDDPVTVDEKSKRLAAAIIAGIERRAEATDADV